MLAPYLIGVIIDTIGTKLGRLYPIFDLSLAGTFLEKGVAPSSLLVIGASLVASLHLCLLWPFFLLPLHLLLLCAHRPTATQKLRELFQI